MAKRTLDAFFSPPSKKPKIDQISSITKTISPPPKTTTKVIGRVEERETLVSESDPRQPPTYTSHTTYPFPIRNLPEHISTPIQDLLITASGKSITNQPHLDLLYFQPLIPHSTATELFNYLRSSLPFYRVQYSISRFGKETQINTPRYTTVFGVDTTSQFQTTSSSPSTIDPSITNVHTTQLTEWNQPTKPVSKAKYKTTPRPIPPALLLLLNLTEALTGDTFNFCLVNYYATGSDSISYHSDDERFLGPNPSIASFTLGARRDFLMKHKPTTNTPNQTGESKSEAPIKFTLASGDMLLMRGETQSNWLHSIPKRKGGEADRGRINITLRRAMVPGGTENYYRYNVGEGPVYRWEETRREMVVWEDEKLKRVK